MLAATPGSMPVTGANKGIGFEIARQAGHTGALVLLGASAPKLSLTLPRVRRRHVIWQLFKGNA